MVFPSRLSKSRYLAGRQCPKQLWLREHRPELAAPAGPAQQAIFDQGHAVGSAAHALFPGGVLVEEGPERFEAAQARTAALLTDAAVPAIFEAACEHGGVRIRVDALERLPGSHFGLREVKGSASVKPEHLHDAAIQKWVLEGCGLAVPSVEIVHVAADFVRGDGPIDWGRFFARTDVTADVDALLPAIDRYVGDLHGVLDGAEPAVEPSPHCFEPYDCAWWHHCTAAKPADWIFTLPRLRAARFEALRSAGIETIAEIPDDVALTELQRRVRDVVRSGEAWVSPDLGSALASVRPPLWFVDFETVNSTIPLYPGTRPFEIVPFQWSLHHLGEDGTLTHRAFLADNTGDPRRLFVESLLDVVRADAAPICVWSGYEGRVLRVAAAALPDLQPVLARLGARLVDLLALTREHVYHPAFGGSFSLKDVAPALVPGFGWDDLGDVADGAVASAAFARLACGEIPPEDAPALRRALLAYCERDTLALVEVYRALCSLAAP